MARDWWMVRGVPFGRGPSLLTPSTAFTVTNMGSAHQGDPANLAMFISVNNYQQLSSRLLCVLGGGYESVSEEP